MANSVAKMNSNKRWRLANPDKERNRKKTYYLRNKEKIREKLRAQHTADPSVLNKKNKIWRDRNKQKLKEYYQKSMSIPSTRIRSLAFQAVQRAKKFKWPFDRDFLLSLSHSPPTECLCCKNTLDYSTGRGRGNRHASPSLDRFDNNNGYVSGNVFIICFHCNDLKGNGSPEDLEKVLQYMRSNAPYLKVAS